MNKIVQQDSHNVDSGSDEIDHTPQKWFRILRSEVAHFKLKLSPAQGWAIIALMDHQWETGWIPDDDLELAKIIGMDIRVWRRNRSAVFSQLTRSITKWRPNGGHLAAIWHYKPLKARRHMAEKDSAKKSENTRIQREKQRAYAHDNPPEKTSICLSNVSSVVKDLDLSPEKDPEALDIGLCCSPIQGARK